MSRAQHLLEKASDASPENLNILVELANTVRAMSRFRDAELLYMRVLDRSPSQFGALVGLGHIAKQRADPNGALAHFKAAAKVNPSHLSLQIEIANTLREMSCFDEAAAAYSRVIERDPGHTGALVGLAHIARTREQWPTALQYFRAAAALRPADLNIQFEIAQTLRAMERLDEAEVVYRSIVKGESSHVGALLGLGYSARRRDDAQLALTHFRAAAEARPTDLNIQMEIAQTLREMEHVADAETIYRGVIAREPEHAGALIGLGFIARGREQWPEALAYFRAAADIRRQDLQIQLEVACTLRAMLRLEEAEATCRRILEQAPEHVGALAALGAMARQRRDYDASIAFFKRAASIKPARLDVLVDLGYVLRDLGQLDEAEAMFLRVVDQTPGDIGSLLGLGSIASLRLDWAAALRYFEAAKSAQPQDLQIQLTTARILYQMERIDDAEACYQQILRESPSEYRALLGLGLIARRRSDWDSALVRFNAARCAAPNELRPQLEIASTLRELLRVDEAEAIFQRLEEDPGCVADPEYKTKKLEHLCSTLQLEKAAAYLSSLGSHHDVPSKAVGLAAGLYAARGQWIEVLNLFRECAIERADKPRMGELLVEALSRAARATGTYTDLVVLLDRLPDKKSNAAVLNLRDQLIEEARLRGAVGQLNGDDISHHTLEIENPLREWRSNLVSRLLHSHKKSASLAPPIAPLKPDKIVYFCTDRNYLPGAVIALASLLRHNSRTLRGSRVVVFCSDEILDLAAVFPELGTAFSVPVDLRPASSLFPAGSDFRTGWGVFTPGHGLSEAAYYRIFAALQLIEEGATGRALYIDCDTCVGPQVDQLFNFDLAGKPLGARREICNLPEIRRAATRLAIPPGEYFNSGVLLFDLSHPKLVGALRHAVEISLNQKHLLTFVDQCALNLAFRDTYAPLREDFNLFVRQETELNKNANDPVVRHFLQRPKPWDPMYASANCVPWFEELAALEHVLEGRQVKRLLALQFPE